MHAHSQCLLRGLHAYDYSFSNGQASAAADAHWLSGLERVETPSTPAAVPSPSVAGIESPQGTAAVPQRPASSTAHTSAPIASPRPIVPGPTSPLAHSVLNGHEIEELRSKIADQAQTISRLEQENSALAQTAERLQQVEARKFLAGLHRRYSHTDCRTPANS